NFSDHGANRLGASALMQGLADGYFVLPPTLANYLAQNELPTVGTDHPEAQATTEAVRERTEALLSINGERTVDSFHRELGSIMWEYCGMERNAEGLTKAIGLIRSLREEFWRNVKVTGTG